MGKYTDALVALLPPGPAWNRESTSVLYKLLDALAQEFDRVEDMGIELIEEMDPRTTDGLLDDWERVAGLPGTCWTPTTDDERRTALHAKLTTRGSQRLQFYLDQALTIGYVVHIERHPYGPFVAGSLCGTPLYGNEWRFVWRVYAIEGTEDSHIMCVFRNWTQAHTAVEFYWIDPTTWTVRTAAGGYTGTFMGGCWCEDLERWFLVGTGGEIQISADAITWYAMTPAGGYSSTFHGIAWSPSLSLLCAVGELGEFQTSPDGITWTARTAAGGYTGEFWGVAWSPSLGLFCAVGDGGEIQTSPDGVTWTARTAAGGFTDEFFSAVWAADLGLFVIGGAGGEIQTSPDGTTWTARTSGATGDITDLCWFPHTEQLVAAAGSEGHVYLSDDGTTWTGYSTNDAPIEAVAAHPELDLLVAVQSSGALDVSHDGQTWANPTGGGYGPYCVVANRERFVVGSQTGKIETSDLTENLSA